MDLSEITIKQANIDGFDFRYADLTGSVLIETRLSDVIFSSANISNVVFYKTIIENIDFSETNGIAKAVFIDCDGMERAKWAKLAGKKVKCAMPKNWSAKEYERRLLSSGKDIPDWLV